MCTAYIVPRRITDITITMTTATAAAAADIGSTSRSPVGADASVREGGNRGDIPLPGTPLRCRRTAGWQLYTTACSRRRRRTHAVIVASVHHRRRRRRRIIRLCRLHCRRRRRDAILYLCTRTLPPSVPSSLSCPREQLFTTHPPPLPQHVYVCVI